MPGTLWMEFVSFLGTQGYSTLMWENGFTPDESQQVCEALSIWAKTTWNVDGMFMAIWSSYDGVQFNGDCEIAYASGAQAYLLPNPFLEGDAEGFLVNFQHILSEETETLFAVKLEKRIGYNAL